MRNVDGVNPVCYVIEIKHIAFTIYITQTVTDTYLMCIHLFDFWEILLLLEFLKNKRNKVTAPEETFSLIIIPSSS